MLLAISALALGIVFLALSAERFVEGAAITAKHLGIPALLVGMLVMGFGSSMPELVVTAIAASEGNTGLALGNAVGSNISNIALILGITALVSPIAVKSSVLTTELPVLVFVTMVAALLLCLDGELGRGDGWLLLALFIGVMMWSIYVGLLNEEDELAVEVEEALAGSWSLGVAIVNMVLGLIVLIVSSRLLVWGGVELATAMGISDVIIGLTVVAIGTSLPELAASLVAVRKNEHDLALGNVIGSNLFNTTLVIGTAGLIYPVSLERTMITTDLPIMIAFTFLLFMSCYSFSGREPAIRRSEAVALLGCYTAYYGFLFWRILGG